MILSFTNQSNGPVALFNNGGNLAVPDRLLSTDSDMADKRQFANVADPVNSPQLTTTWLT